MIYQLTVPAAVPGVDEVRILRWHKAPGAAIAVGERIVAMETHNAVIEVRAGQPGVLRQVLVQPGAWRAVGLPVAIFSSTVEEALPEDVADVALMVAEFEVS